MNEFLPSRGELCPKIKLLKIRFRIVVSIAALFLVSISTYAQKEPSNKQADSSNVVVKAVDLTTLGIQIGEQVPDVVLENIHNYTSNTLRLSDFKGKLLILDFWATWCAPCVGMIPEMDSIQKELRSKIQFLSVTYQDADDVLPFMNRLQEKHGREYNLPIITSDTTLSQLFPHKYLPHYVWIDGKGVVQAITGAEEITLEKVQDQLDGGNQHVRKRDMYLPYDNTKPLFIENNGGSVRNLQFRSILTGYIEGLPGGYTITKDSATHNIQKLSLRNTSLSWMYAVAYGEGKQWFIGDSQFENKVSKPHLISTDKTGKAYTNWKQNHGYSYELIVPEYIADSAYKLMQDDLDRLFPQFRAEVVKKKRKCLALIRTSDQDRIKSTGDEHFIEFTPAGGTIRNYTLSYLIMRLKVLYLQNLEIPLIDETKYPFPVDIEISADLRDVASINKALDKYDLKFIEKDAYVHVLTLEDNPEYSNFTKD